MCLKGSKDAINAVRQEGAIMPETQLMKKGQLQEQNTLDYAKNVIERLDTKSG